MKHLKLIDIIIPTSDKNSSLFKNCYKSIKQMTGYVNIITCNAEENFSKAVNKELKKSNTEFVCLLNDDTEVQKDWLKYLVDRMNKDKEIGICGSKLLYPNTNIIQHAGIEILNNDIVLYGRGEEDSPKYNVPGELECVTFACALLRKTMINEVGFLDEDFKFFFEDVDYCLRARVAGWKVFYEPASIVFHHESATIKKRKWSIMLEESRRKFIRKWKLGGKNGLAYSRRM